MESLYRTLSRIGEIQRNFSPRETNINPSPPTQDSSLAANPAGKDFSPDISFLNFLSNAEETTRNPFNNLIDEASQKYGLPNSLIKSVIQVESNFDQEAISPKGAMGLMQLMPSTAEQYRVGKPYSPAENIDAGSRHLRKLIDRYDGNLIKALAAYNAGENAFRDDKIPGYRETQAYVKKVINNYMKYNGVNL